MMTSLLSSAMPFCCIRYVQVQMFIVACFFHPFHTGLTVSVYVGVLVAIVILAAVVVHAPKTLPRRNRDDELQSMTAHRLS